MLINTKHFGQINLEEEKVLYFDQGLLGFEEFKRYTILFDNDNGERPNVSWLQCVDEASLSIPIINPFLIKEDYNPEVEDELLESLGEINGDNLVVLTSITVPADINQISTNLKAPFLINADTRKGIQIIADNSDYDIKYYFYDKLDKIKLVKGAN